jgi:polysaccharide biosynthesis/export protein
VKELLRIAGLVLLCASGVASGQTPAPTSQPPSAPPATQPPPAQPPTTAPAPTQRPTTAAPAPTVPPAGSGATSTPAAPVGATATAPAARGVDVPPDYVIGPDDVLDVIFWRDKDMSALVSVRPDGRVTLPLLNDVQAAGLTPEQLRSYVMTTAAKYVEDPNVTIVVKAINSRKIFVTGMVSKPGPYSLIGPTSVMQALAMAGGIQEFADSKNIIIMRTENGRQVAYRFNYKEVVKRKNLKQNIELKPGDTVVVP